MSDARMTVEDIRKQFPDEWVLLADPEYGEGQHVVGGQLLFHSPDRDAFDKQALELRPTNAAILFTGTLPKGTAVLL